MNRFWIPKWNPRKIFSCIEKINNFAFNSTMKLTNKHEILINCLKSKMTSMTSNWEKNVSLMSVQNTIYFINTLWKTNCRHIFIELNFLIGEFYFFFIQNFLEHKILYLKIRSSFIVLYETAILYCFKKNKLCIILSVYKNEHFQKFISKILKSWCTVL